MGSAGAALYPLARRPRSPLLLVARATDLHHWQPPPKFERQRQPISPADLDQDDLLGSLCKLLRGELNAIRQTLDFPPEAMSGLTRNGLLTMHAIRLRQVERWLWPRLAARTIRQMIA